VTEVDWQTPWSTMVLPFETFTGDRRWFRAGSLRTRQLPMPLMLQVHTDNAHRGAVVVGSVRGVDLGETRFTAGGTWLNPEHVPEVSRALELMANGLARVSADLEPDMDITVEDPGDGSRPFVFYDRATVSGVTIVPISAFDQPSLVPMAFSGSEFEALAITGTTSWRSMAAQPREVEYNADQAFKNILAWADGNDARARSMFLWMDPQAAEGTRDRFRLPVGDVVNGKPALNFHAIYAAAALVSGAHGGLPTVSDEERGRLRRTISEIYARLAGLFGDPALVAPWDKRSKLPDVQSNSLDAVAASAAPLAPPAAWFADPKFEHPVSSPIVTCDGRVMVHLATRDSCHRAIQQQTGQCFTPPESPSAYARFMDGTVLTAEGKTLPVGRITIGGTHAGLGLTAAATKLHYDNTTSCVAVVAAGEDQFGIWLAGSLVPEATAEQVAALRRSPISGDWRRHGDNGLDLIAALAVNTAGFPAPPRGTVRSLSVDVDSNCVALVASGAPMGDDTGMGQESDSVAGDAVVEPVTAAPVAGGEDFQAAVQAAVEATLRQRDERDEVQAQLAALFEADRFELMSTVSAMEPVAALAPMPDTAAGRRQAQRAGRAMPPAKPGGTARYPIRNVEELGKAIHAVGRGSGSHDEIRRWIIQRARELGRSKMIPSNWKPDGSTASASIMPHGEDENTCLACKNKG
jgi:hypothetical protein